MDGWRALVVAWQLPSDRAVTKTTMEIFMKGEFELQALYDAWLKLVFPPDVVQSLHHSWLGSYRDSVRNIMFQLEHGKLRLPSGKTPAEVVALATELTKIAQNFDNGIEETISVYNLTEREPIPTITDMIEGVIGREGGLSDHPDDRGGLTKFGITLPTLRSYRADAKANDLERLTRSEAYDIYYTLFYKQTGMDFFKDECPEVAIYLFDAIVHHGPSRAIKLWQEIVGAKVDGVLGEDTRRRSVKAIRTFGAMSLISAYLTARLEFIERIVKNDPTQQVFLQGWRNRIATLTRVAESARRPSANVA